MNLTSLGSGARILSCLIRIGAIGRRWRHIRGRVLTCYWGFDAVELLVVEVAVRWIAMLEKHLRLDRIVGSESTKTVYAVLQVYTRHT